MLYQPLRGGELPDFLRQPRPILLIKYGYVQVSMLDRLKHFGNTVFKPTWRHCWRIVLRVTQGLTKHRQYFVLTQSQ